MEINPNDYNIEGLPVGTELKTQHCGCSDSNALKITVGVEGTLLHCFKCGESKFISAGYLTFRDRKRREAEKAALIQEKSRTGYSLPADFSHKIKGAGLAWLGHGGWTQDLIDRYGVGWSDKLSRVIIPIHPQGYIARAVYKDQGAKYLSKAPPGAFWRTDEVITKGTPYVVTEDVLSAARVGEFVQAEALLGTPKTWQPPIGISNLFIWTDADAAGRRCRTVIRKSCQWLGVAVHDIETPKDPKEYSREEIRRVLTKYV